MAQEIISLGTGDNTGNGDPLRTSLTKIQNNFSELYNGNGWGYYKDDEASDLTVNTTASLIEINGLDSNSNSNYLPLGIRGVSELWSSDKINAISVGDGYDVRLDLAITAKTGSPTYIDLQFDIGGGASPTIVIVSKTISLVKTPPYNVSATFPLFSLTTFVANGGQMFVKTDTGTVTIGSRAILIKRDSVNLG
jgi:hypothetical protein